MSAPLWTWTDFANAIGGDLVGTPDDAVTGISIDSRAISAGEAFFAIKGDQFDGHDFVDAALKAGAAIAVVDTDWAGKNTDHKGPLLVVPDVLDGMRKLARAARARSNAKIIAVTGSVGKTGTKEALRIGLSASGAVHAAVASFNNHWGVPLTLARMPADAEFGVFEIGMNHPGEITLLVEMVQPHIAVITTVAPVHLEYFSSVEEIARAKAEIFSGLRPGGTALLNADIDHFKLLKKLAKSAGVQNITTFGEAVGSDARLDKTVLHANCSCVTATILGDQLVYKLGAPGKHVVQNSLAVLAAIKVAGGDLAKGALALADLAPPKGRGARHSLQVATGRATLIDESYNANPASMAAAIALLGQAPIGPRGRRIAVLGDMLELGSASDDLHSKLIDDITAAGIDRVYLAGPHMAALWEKLPATNQGAYAADAEALQSQVIKALAPGDAMMVKGSLGSRMGPIVTALLDRYATQQPVSV